MNASIGDAYLDHYERHFGMPVDRVIFEGKGRERTIQVLAYDGVFQNCRVFCSLGLSHYSESVHGLTELVLPLDAGWTSSSEVVANALFFAIDQKMAIGRGVSIAGLSRIRPAFADSFGKEAIYFTVPIGFPDSFGFVRADGMEGRMIMGMFITRREHEFFEDHGCENFEKLLEAKEVDPFHLARPSVV